MMKERTLFLTLTLTMAMSMTALTGCGTKTSATDDAIVEETPTTEEDTMKEEVVVAGEDDTSATENDIIEFDDSSTISEYDFTNMEFEDESIDVTATSKIPVYSADGYFVGNIKEGSTITITEHGVNSIWHRFKNPVSGTDYEYLYVSEKDFSNEEDNTSSNGNNEANVTKDMVKDAIETSLMSSIVEHTILDSKPSDMEGSVTVKVSKNDASYVEMVQNQLYYPEDGSDNILNWSTYYIELANEDDTSIEYKVYYKDAFDLDQLKEEYKNSQTNN